LLGIIVTGARKTKPNFFSFGLELPSRAILRCHPACKFLTSYCAATIQRTFL